MTDTPDRCSECQRSAVEGVRAPAGVMLLGRFVDELLSACARDRAGRSHLVKGGEDLASASSLYCSLGSTTSFLCRAA